MNSINEQLAVKEGHSYDKDFHAEIARLKREDLQKKIKPAFTLFANGQEALDEDVHGNFIALVQLRNEFIHYKPDWDATLLDWPLRLQAALDRSKQKPVDSDWTVNFNTKPILDWAKESTEAILSDFLRAIGQDEKQFFKL